MKIKRLMAGLLCGAVGAATLGLSGCGNAADSGMMDAAKDVYKRQEIDGLARGLVNEAKRALFLQKMLRQPQLCDSPQPVSYTHLDVYKRQAVAFEIPLLPA